MALTLLLGGARSGKSALALRKAEAFEGKTFFVATAEARDEEMVARIDRHREERPGQWTTLEEPLHLEDALSACPRDACVVVDCLSLWVANLLERGDDESSIARRAGEVGSLAADRSGPTIAVSNEVGMGIVPASELARRYRDALGRVNAIWADRAAEVALVFAGRALALEGVDVR